MGKGLLSLTSRQTKSIENLLTIPNPAFTKSIRLNLPIRVPPYLHYYWYDNGDLNFPIGATSDVLAVLGDGWKVNDLRNEKALECEYSLNFDLWDFQEKALKELEDKTLGVIESPTGSGKSFLMLKLIEQKKQNTIILVDTYELANQFKARFSDINKKTGKPLTSLKAEDVGYVGEGKKIWKPITVALLQTMRNLSEEEMEYVNTNFGMVLCDEAHILPANTFFRALNRLNIKYKYGFSGTAFRDDGLTDVIFWCAGPKVVTIPPEDTGGRMLKPELEIVKSNFDWPLIQTSDYTYMISDLSINAERNNLIVNHYKAGHENSEKQTVFLCTLRTQVYELWRLLGKTGGVLISPLGDDIKAKLKEELHLSDEEIKEFGEFGRKKSRVNIINGLKDGSINTVVTTYKLFNKGIDISTLTLLYFCGPTRSRTIVLQSRGRIVRKLANKHPRIIHIWDDKINLLKNQGYAVHRLIRQGL